MCTTFVGMRDVGAVIFQDDMSSSQTCQQTKQPRFAADVSIDWQMEGFF